MTGSVTGVDEIRAVLPLAETLAAVRGASGAVVIVVVPHDLPAVDRAMLIAAIGPLAIERAPERRVCALDLGVAADPADVAAALRFLAGAASTTGQVLGLGQAPAGGGASLASPTPAL